MPKPWQGTPRGILQHDWQEQCVVLSRFEPRQELAQSVEYYWAAHWHIPEGEVHREESLPHPCVHVVFEDSEQNAWRTQAWGVVRGKFVRELSGQGWTFGIKFMPAGFAPWVNWPVSELTDTTAAIQSVFDADSQAIEQAIRSAETPNARAETAERFLHARWPKVQERFDENQQRVAEMVNCILSDPTVTRVEDLSDRFHLGHRQLQRLFQRYVGVNPKWVLQRYRLHQAVQHMTPSTPKRQAEDWAQLALSLGYTDQAHFINDFKAAVGLSPGCFRKQWD